VPVSTSLKCRRVRSPVHRHSQGLIQTSSSQLDMNQHSLTSQARCSAAHTELRSSPRSGSSHALSSQRVHRDGAPYTNISPDFVCDANLVRRIAAVGKCDGQVGVGLGESWRGTSACRRTSHTNGMVDTAPSADSHCCGGDQAGGSCQSHLRQLSDRCRYARARRVTGSLRLLLSAVCSVAAAGSIAAQRPTSPESQDIVRRLEIGRLPISFNKDSTSGYDPQSGELRQTIDDRFRDSVAEIL
jgi:hypothetical protein